MIDSIPRTWESDKLTKPSLVDAKRSETRGTIGHETRRKSCKKPCNSSHSLYGLKYLERSKFWKALQFGLKNGLFENEGFSFGTKRSGVQILSPPISLHKIQASPRTRKGLFVAYPNWQSKSTGRPFV